MPGWDFPATMVHRCHLTMGFMKGLCLLFTNGGHIHLGSTPRGMQSHRVTARRRKAASVLRRTGRPGALAANTPPGDLSAKTDKEPPSWRLCFSRETSEVTSRNEALSVLAVPAPAHCV